MEREELKKEYYYEIFTKIRGMPSNDKVVKYLGNRKIQFLDNKEILELDETLTTHADKQLKDGKNITYIKGLFGFRNISIDPKHLEKLGFIKKEGNLYEMDNPNIKIMMNLAILGDENFNYIGNIVMNNNEHNILMQKIEEKKEELNKKYHDDFEITNKSQYKIINDYYDFSMWKHIEQHNEIVTIINENFKGIRNINELFKRLEKEGIKIENKDEVVM